MVLVVFASLVQAIFYISSTAHAHQSRAFALSCESLCGRSRSISAHASLSAAIPSTYRLQILNSNSRPERAPRTWTWEGQGIKREGRSPYVVAGTHRGSCTHSARA